MFIIVNRMDTHDECCMVTKDFLKEIYGKKMVAGAKQLRKCLQSGRASRVYLAENADPAITEPIKTLCESIHVSYAWISTMVELGHACGIDVGAAAAAAVDR